MFIYASVGCDHAPLTQQAGLIFAALHLTVVLAAPA